MYRVVLHVAMSKNIISRSHEDKERKGENVPVVLNLNLILSLRRLKVYHLVCIVAAEENEVSAISSTLDLRKVKLTRKFEI